MSVVTKLNICHTPCRSCVFAETNGKTQTGCAFGRLDKFREQGVEIVEAEDGETEFYIVNGRKCTAFRDENSSWAKAVPQENRKAAVRAELIVRTTIVIPVDSVDDSTLPSLESTVTALKGLHLAPAAVAIVSNQGEIPVSKIAAVMAKAGGGLSWHITDIKERDKDGRRVDRGRAIDLAFGKFKGHFYSVWEPGTAPPDTFTLDLDRAVTDELGRFAVVLPKCESGLTVAMGFHKTVEGNRPTTANALSGEEDEKELLGDIVAKATFMARKSPHLVAKWSELCPS